jgi:hypothetical protein
MLRRLALVRTDVSKERRIFIIRVTRIGELARSVLRLLVNANVVPSSRILITLMMEALCSSETSLLTRATRRHIPDNDTVHNHLSEISDLTWIYFSLQVGGDRHILLGTSLDQCLRSSLSKGLETACVSLLNTEAHSVSEKLFSNY